MLLFSLFQLEACPRTECCCSLYFSWKHVLGLNAVVLSICLFFAVFLPQIGIIIRYVLFQPLIDTSIDYMIYICMSNILLMGPRIKMIVKLNYFAVEFETE